MTVETRLMQKNDFQKIMDIYNQAILAEEQTADLDVLTVEDRADWFAEHLQKEYPILVAVQNEEIVAWAALSPYRKGRRALQGTTEVSFYVDTKHKSKGIGTLLLKTLIEKASSLGYTNLLAILIESNSKSISLLKRFKFELWGTLTEIVEIKDKKLNHCIYGRSILV